MTGRLIPEAVTARAAPRGRLAFAFAPRFFVMLLAGLVWLIPAWWWPQLAAAMFLWDALALCAWLYDLLRLPAPGQLEARRTWTAPLSLGRPNAAAIELVNHGRAWMEAHLIDAVPLALRDAPPAFKLVLPAGDSAQARYEILPRERGDARCGGLYIRYRSAFGLAERWAAANLAQTVRVLPDLVEARDQALYLIRSRQIEMEKRRRRQRGLGREFESLREYRDGDDLRDVCWTATARRRQLITKEYEAERSQTVWLVVDAGRLLRAQVENAALPFRLAKLDYSVNAALSLAQVASQFGDKVGLIAYGRSVQQAVGAGRGAPHVRGVVDALAQVRSEGVEANHAQAARVLLERQKRRALVVWITDFSETPATPDVIESAVQASRRHLVLFAAIGQPDLAALAGAIPRTEEEMYRHAAAVEIVERREALLGRLRQQGALAVELAPERACASLVNEYLEIKDRSLL